MKQNIFISKKVRREIRQRKRKVNTEDRPSENDEVVSVTKMPSDPTIVTEFVVSNKKRKRCEVINHNNNIENNNINIKNDIPNQIIPIHIPNNITSKEAKKIRKEARREARKLGQEESMLHFIYEKDQEPKIIESESKSSTITSHNNVTSIQQEDTPCPATKKEKIKKHQSNKQYPRINDILDQHAKTQAFTLQRQKLEEHLSPSIKAQYVALDCEMVGVGSDGKQSALARVSIVDWDGKTLLDTFVQVPQRVTDFRTHVSGVKPKDIKEDSHNKTQTLMDVVTCRKTVSQILEGKIVIGHALQNDFRALMLSLPKERIRDTARYPPLMKARGKNGGKLRPRKLRDLVLEYVMGMEIQKKGLAHSSVEDATGVMEVYKSVREGWEKYLDDRKNHRKKVHTISSNNNNKALLL